MLKKVENKKAHFKQINAELEQTANQLVEKINALYNKKKHAKKVAFYFGDLKFNFIFALEMRPPA